MSKQLPRHTCYTGTLIEPKHPGDVGWDLPSLSFNEQFLAGTSSNVFQIFTGVRLYIPAEAYRWAEIRPRSSALQKHGLIVIPGTIDMGYRGEIVVSVFQTRWGCVEEVVKKNIPVAQLVFHDACYIPHEDHPKKLDPSEFTDLALAEASSRGEQGFGSTDLIVDKTPSSSVDSLDALEIETEEND